MAGHCDVSQLCSHAEGDGSAVVDGRHWKVDAAHARHSNPSRTRPRHTSLHFWGRQHRRVTRNAQADTLSSRWMTRAGYVKALRRADNVPAVGSSWLRCPRWLRVSRWALCASCPRPLLHVSRYAMKQIGAKGLQALTIADRQKECSSDCCVGLSFISPTFALSASVLGVAWLPEDRCR